MDEQATRYWQRYQQLRAMWDAGQMDPEQFATEMQQLRWQDESGAWWAIDANGGWLFYDGQSWAPAQPPVAAAQPPVAPEPVTVVGPAPSPALAAAPTSSALSPLLRRLGPFVAFLPSVLCGGLWFLYTFVGVFKYEGLRGIDFITPLIVAGLPILIWVLRAPLDQLLLPAKPVIQSVPRPLRLGISLAIPVFLGCGCSMLSSSGYMALRASALISVVAATVLLRY